MLIVTGGGGGGVFSTNILTSVTINKMVPLLCTYDTKLHPSFLPQRETEEYPFATGTARLFRLIVITARIPFPVLLRTLFIS